MIRPMVPEDLPAVCALEKVCFSDPWSDKSLEGELKDNPFSRGWILEKDGQTAAYAFCWEVFERAELANIAVAPAFRRQGLGRELMQFLMEQAREAGCEFMNLEARVSNEAAISLYESLGFIKVADIRQYYDNGEDAICMSAVL